MNIDARIRFNSFRIEVLNQNETNDKDLRKYFCETHELPQDFDTMSIDEIDECFNVLENIYLGKGSFRSFCKKYLGNDVLLV